MKWAEHATCKGKQEICVEVLVSIQSIRMVKLVTIAKIL